MKMEFCLKGNFLLFQTMVLLCCSLALSHGDNIKCNNEIETKSVLSEALNFLDTWIIPGTKWCGPGNISANNDDLGPEREADTCCRAHDMCDKIIEGNRTKHGLTNTVQYTRLSCNCDNEFYKCLKKANTWTSNFIGFLYFNASGTQCFKEEHPIEYCNKCITHLDFSFRGKRCVDYKFNQKMPKKNQWFDLPFF